MKQQSTLHPAVVLQTLTTILRIFSFISKDLIRDTIYLYSAMLSYKFDQVKISLFSKTMSLKKKPLNDSLTQCLANI